MTKAWNTKRVTATGTVVKGGCEYGGIICQTAGTTMTATVYDDVAVVAANLVTPTTGTMTAGTAYGQHANPAGVFMKNGIHVVVGGTPGSMLVLWR